MAWIVTWDSKGSKESAEATGADPEGNVVMFAITPNYIAEVYNRYRNNVDENELGFEDRWGLLSDEQREELLNAIEGYINKHLCIDEDLISILDGVEARFRRKKSQIQRCLDRMSPREPTLEEIEDLIREMVRWLTR